jgi:hypothetical protein
VDSHPQRRKRKNDVQLGRCKNRENISDDGLEDGPAGRRGGERITAAEKRELEKLTERELISRPIGCGRRKRKSHREKRDYAEN